jgi:hypothetical protein
VGSGGAHYNRPTMKDSAPKPAVEAADVTAKPARRRSARKWLVRIAVGAAAFVLAAYATLPYWLPTGRLARYFEQQLSLSLNREVRIGAIRIGWLGGISIENVTVADRGGRPDELFARIGRINCGFTPLTTLRTGRVDRLEISDPEVWLSFDEQDRLVSLTDLGHSRRGDSGFPTWEYRIHRASCHLRMPELMQTFRVDDLTCRIDKPAGIVSVSGETVIPRMDPDLAPGELATARLLVEGKIISPRLRKDTVLHGQGRVEWEGLAITDLPLLVAMKFPIEQLDGSTNGRLTFSVHPDLRIDFGLLIGFRSVLILRRGTTQPARVPDADFTCKGLRDPVTDRLSVYEYDYQTRAVHVRGTGTPERPALTVEPAGEVSLALHADGRVKDWTALGSEFPDVARWTRSAMVRVDGGADFSLDFTRRRDEDRLVAAIEGRQLACGFGPVPSEFLCADPDIAKRLRVDVSHNRTSGRYTQKEVSLSVGGMTLASHGGMTVPGQIDPENWGRLTTIFPSLEYELLVRVADLGEIARLLPPSRRDSAIIKGRGAAELKFSLVPQASRSQLNLSLSLPAETQLDLGSGFLVKPAGQPLSLSAGVGIPHQLSGPLDGLVLDIAHGQAGVHLESREAQLDVQAVLSGERSVTASQPERGAGGSPVLDATWNVPLKIHGVETLAGLFPGLGAAADSAQMNLRGDADLAIRGRLMSGAGDWLVRNELTFKAEGLAARVADVLDKPAGSPVDLTVAHQCQSAAGRCEQSLSVLLRQPAGEMSGSLVFSEGLTDDEGDDFESTTIKVTLKDINRLLAMAPSLRDLLACGQPVGGVTLELQSLLVDGRLSADMSLDATDAGVRSTTSAPFDKPPGAPARMHFAWEMEPTPLGATDERWHITAGSMQVGGFAATQLTGLIIAEPRDPSLRFLKWARQTVRQPRLPSRLRAAALHAEGQLNLDDPLWQGHPVFKDWRRRLDLSGSLAWSLETGLDDQLCSLRGRFDAGAMGLSCDLGQSTLPTLVKPQGTPAGLSFHLTAVPSREAKRMDIEAREVEIDLNGNKLGAGGLLKMDADEGGCWRAGEFAVDAHAYMLNPSAARDLFPRCPLELLDGAALASVSVSGTPTHMSIGSAEAVFDRLMIGAGSEPIGLDGQVAFEQGRLRLDQLECSWGQSRATLAGVIHEAEKDQPRRARLGLYLERFDEPELVGLIKKLPFATPAESRPEGGSTDVKLAIINVLRRLNLDLDVRIDQALGTLPMEVQVKADAAVDRVTVNDGYVNMNFGAVVDGGVVTGSFMSDLARSDPTIYLKYTASRIQPGPLVDKYLSLTFPGMKANGPLTLIDETYQKLSPAPGEPNYEVGEGELIIEGGTVGGRAAPSWMTRIFPGLNFSTFDFSYMHSWFKKREDGYIRHQMIFQGRFYSVYMVGGSKPGGPMEYEVGIDFLADFDSRYWAESGQGRVPLFTKTGRIMPDGHLADEEVVYVPQQFILSLLVKNNPVVTAYHVVRKRVRGEQ